MRDAREARDAVRGGGRDVQSLADEEVRNQDATLDFLHGSVSNLKNMGGEISKEIDLHCTLLNDLEGQADTNTRNLRQQQAKLEQLAQQVPTCYLWAYICCVSTILFVLLVFF